jgi:hypothetical protein
MNDITILIQGPLDNISLNNLEYYNTLGKVIVSSWDWCDQSIIQSHEDKNNFEKILSKQPDKDIQGLDKIFHHKSSFIYQIYSIYHGLMKCTTKYIIKTRSDEFYSNLNPLIEIFLKDDRKFVSSNFTWAFGDHGHIGDHLYIWRTELLREVFSIIFNKIKSIPPIQPEHCAPSIPPECTLSYHIMKISKKEFPELENKILDRFDLINVNELGNYHLSWKLEGKFWNKDFPLTLEEQKSRYLYCHRNDLKDMSFSWKGDTTNTRHYYVNFS